MTPYLTTVGRASHFVKGGRKRLERASSHASRPFGIRRPGRSGSPSPSDAAAKLDSVNPGVAGRPGSVLENLAGGEACARGSGPCRPGGAQREGGGAAGGGASTAGR